MWTSWNFLFNFFFNVKALLSEAGGRPPPASAPEWESVKPCSFSLSNSYCIQPCQCWIKQDWKLFTRSVKLVRNPHINLIILLLIFFLKDRTTHLGKAHSSYIWLEERVYHFSTSLQISSVACQHHHTPVSVKTEASYDSVLLNCIRPQTLTPNSQPKYTESRLRHKDLAWNLIFIDGKVKRKTDLHCLLIFRFRY